MNNAIPENTILTCGCCGEYFSTDSDYEDQGQDVGFGICPSCDEDAGKRSAEFYDETISLISNALEGDKKQRFDQQPRIRQEAIVRHCMDKGILRWHIGQ